MRSARIWQKCLSWITQISKLTEGFGLRITFAELFTFLKRAFLIFLHLGSSWAMDQQEFHAYWFLMFLVLIVQCEGKAEIAYYIVDCSACNYLPLTRVESYQCNVRCDVQGENPNTFFAINLVFENDADIYYPQNIEAKQIFSWMFVDEFFVIDNN